jgi:hypothetical protein
MAGFLSFGKSVILLGYAPRVSSCCFMVPQRGIWVDSRGIYAVFL